MHVSSNRPVSEDEEKLMMYSPGGPFIMVAPVVMSWAVAGQRMVFLHMYLQTQVTLNAFPVATPRGRSSSSHEGELRFGHLRDKTRLTLMYHVCKHHVSITVVLLLKDNLLKHVFGN